MPGTLFVVATPIGNLEDITLRALRVLREVDLIAAEDTRRTAQLLAHFGISTPTTSFHAHNTRSKLPGLIARLGAGEHIAVVTDAGTPGVADPGVELVQACIDTGIRVDALPGPNASLTAAIASGFPLQQLTIFGFAPPKAKDRRAWLQSISATAGTVTFFESPHRIGETLSDLEAILVARPIAVCRELTKMHEEVLRGTPADVIGQLTAIRGEFTIVIGPPPLTAGVASPVSDEELLEEFGRMSETGLASRRDAVAAVARKFSRPAREVYAAVERAKKLAK